LEQGNDFFFENYKEFLPTFTIKQNKIVLKLPDFPGILSEKHGLKYAKILNNSLYEAFHKDITNITLDLRKNHGGDQVPMILGLQSLLPNGPSFSLIYRHNKVIDVHELKDNRYISKTYSRQLRLKKFKFDFDKIKITVLISKQTISAGEITALCFYKNKNVTIIGNRSGGYLTNIYSFNYKDYHIGFTSSLFMKNDKIVKIIQGQK
jgi:C-terminal processing protease CtpA/Prc